MAFDTQKFIMRFANEAKEHMLKLNNGLLALEKNPNDIETINEIFRAAHTTKGASKMLKLTSITEVAHKLEDILDGLRGKKIIFTKDMLNLLFSGVDAMSDMINTIGSGAEITKDYKELCDKLEKAGKSVDNAKDETPLVQTKEDIVKGADLSTLATMGVPTGGDKSPSPPLEMSFLQSQSEPSEIIRKPQRAETFIKVSTEKLDELIKLIGEILSSHIKIKERLLDVKKLGKLSNKGEASHELPLLQSIKGLYSRFRDDLIIYDLLIGDLRERALNMRMLPLTTLFEQFPRLVRDIASSSGKEVEFIMEGEQTELDKKIIEKIEDSFIHLLRNSVDHGIETPELRIKKGKTRTGTIRLSACYEGGSVLIELSDDGAGISLQKIKEKALMKKLFNEETLNKMTPAELTDLIFYPGFSTSEIITDVSGRGVGMDVVKKSITGDLKGHIEIKSIIDKGTAFYIRLPLTLAITRVLLVSVDNITFAIPSNYCQELLRVSEKEIIPVAGLSAIRLREQFIHVTPLSSILFKGHRKDQVLTGGADYLKDKLLILIIKSGEERLGLIIDAIIAEEDMVIKPLPSHMQKNKLISGIIISGNNDLINILHAPSLIEHINSYKVVRPIKDPESLTQPSALKILVVDDSINTREIEQDILVSYGYNVDLASDGITAVEMAKTSKYDVVITDVEMPRMDGFTLTQTLRQESNYKYTPIIIVTSREKEEDKKRGIAVGANAYIVKGAFEQNNLIETIRNLTG